MNVLEFFLYPKFAYDIIQDDEPDADDFLVQFLHFTYFSNEHITLLEVRRLLREAIHGSALDLHTIFHDMYVMIKISYELSKFDGEKPSIGSYCLYMQTVAEESRED